MAYFITNEDKALSLKGRLKILVKHSQEMKFLTGFFYFSGINELYEALRELYNTGREFSLKILVGLNVDRTAFYLYEYPQRLGNPETILREYLTSLQKAFTSKELDIEEVYEQFNFFKKLLEEGKLEIRKTREPVHAKLYIFKFGDDISSVLPNLFITGSSNLTRAGLKGQYEFNVEIKDFGFEKAEKYFDNLWNTSVKISKDDIIETIEKRTFFRKITPFEAYVYLIKTYIDLHKSREIERNLKLLMEEKGYKPYSFQLEAVSQAVKMIKAHNGVILADVVGLGKTVIASLIARSLNKRGLVLAPPHLIGDDNKTYGWRKYLEDFGLYDWEVRSIGKLEETLEYVKKTPDIEIIIVDEAHRFRNERTKSYYYLSEICRGKNVILITATPFNNKPSDIFAMLKLFTIPKRSTIIYDENLKYRFDSYHREFEELSYIKKYHNSPDEKRRKRARNLYKKIFEISRRDYSIDIDKVDNRISEIAREIRAIIEPVVIRRNRLDLRYYGEDIDFPKVKDPQEIFFELTREQSAFYDEVINFLRPFDEGGMFTGAIYFPARYEKQRDFYGDSEIIGKEENFLFVYQRNLYEFMRRLLVKRFESSFGAFIESINRFKRFNEIAFAFAKTTGKYILNRKLMEEVVELFEAGDEEEAMKKLAEYSKEILENKNPQNSRYYKIYELEKFKDKGRKFLEDIEQDRELFDYFLKKAEELKLVEHDPKVRALRETLDKFLEEGRKIVIFTEYIDTANYLKEKLKDYKNLLPAYGNLSASIVRAINENFDAQYKEQSDEYDILLTTDKLSEGFNLNRAGVVINYDIPWNPVRVIQRLGRINRIGKKVYDDIYIINFFPTEKGADIVKSKEIAMMKIFMIHNILGEDAKIFSPDEEPEPSKLYKRLNAVPEEEESFFSIVYNELKRIKDSHPEVIKKIEDLPSRVKVAKRGEKNEVLVFVKRGEDLFVGYKDYNSPLASPVSFEFAYPKIKCDEETEPLPLSSNFWLNYHEVLDKRMYQFADRRRRNDDITRKAINLLSTLLNMEEFKRYEKFLSDLREDIVEYGTLSKYVLSIITTWSYKTSKDVNKTVKSIEKLRKELGEDFLDKVKKKLYNIEEDVIVAIENRM